MSFLQYGAQNCPTCFLLQLTEAALNPLIKITNEDIKQHWRYQTGLKSRHLRGTMFVAFAPDLRIKWTVTHRLLLLPCGLGPYRWKISLCPHKSIPGLRLLYKLHYGTMADFSGSRSVKTNTAVIIYSSGTLSAKAALHCSSYLFIF